MGYPLTCTYFRLIIFIRGWVFGFTLVILVVKSATIMVFIVLMSLYAGSCAKMRVIFSSSHMRVVCVSYQ